MTVQKEIYTITAADIIAASDILLIPVLWRSPFACSDYAVSITLEAGSAASSGLFNLMFSNVSNLSAAGFTAVVYYDSSVFVAGDRIVIHAMAQEL